MFTRSRSKWLTVLLGLGGLGTAGYYLTKTLEELAFQEETVDFIKEIQSNSTVITLLNSYISKTYGTQLTSTLQNEVIKKFDPEAKSFSFTMGVRKADDQTQNPDFAQVMSSCTKVNDIWYIDSLDIKFTDSNSNSWLKLYEMLHFDASKKTKPSLKSLLESKNLKDSDEYLKSFASTQPFMLKSLDILVKDKQKLNNLGPPIRLIDHDIFTNEPEINVKLRIEGKKRNADLIFDAEKVPNKKDWDISALFLMYELNEDYVLSTPDLAKKYSDQVVEKMQKDKKYSTAGQIADDVNLAKIIEDKLVKNTRIMNNIGRPITFDFDPKDEFNFVKKNAIKLKFKIYGKLNLGELILEAKRDNSEQQWKSTNVDLKVIWNNVK